MVEGGGVAAFPVVFFDGEKEMNIGTIQINRVLEYKPFQLMVSKMIGISPNQISIYLVDQNKDPALPFSQDRRRIPITGKVNFGLICALKDCYFLAVLKRSRKPRNRREKMNVGVEFSNFIPSNEFSSLAMHPILENRVLLRRNQPAPFYDQISQSELEDLNGRLLKLSYQRENYQLAMEKGGVSQLGFDLGQDRFTSSTQNLNLDHFSDADDFFRISSSMTMTKKDSNKPFCTECVEEEKNASTASFHACVRDPVITRFTSRLGPINRPK